MTKDQRIVTVKKRLITLDPKYRKSPYPYAIPFSVTQNLPLTGQQKILSVEKMTGEKQISESDRKALQMGENPVLIDPDQIYPCQHSRTYELSYRMVEKDGDKSVKEFVNPRDVAEFGCFTENKDFCAGSKKEFNKKKHIFYVEDKELEAEQDLVEFDLAYEAEKFLREGSTSRWKDAVLLLNYEIKEYNLDPDILSDSMIKKLALEGAQKYPKVVMKLNTEDAESLLFALKLLRHGIVSKRNGADFYQGNDYIGTTIDSVKDYINKPANASLVTKWANQLNPKGKTK